MLKREPIPDDLLVTDRRPDPIEVPRGFRLRRIGPGQWVAEPFSIRWRVWGVVLASCTLTCAATIQAMRVHHLRRAQQPVVVVNGVPIRRDQMYQDLEQRHGRKYVHRMVSQELLRQFASERGCWPSEAEVDERYAKEAQRPGFQEKLVASDVTEREYRDDLRLRLAEVNLIIQGVRATEADVRYFYKRNTDPRNPNALFRTPDRMQVAVIATHSKAEAQQALMALIRDEPWPKVVAQFSVDPSRERAGLLDPLERGRSPFSKDHLSEETVFRLREGERSAPVFSGGKWWIVRCIRRWPALVVPFDQARRDAEMGARIEIGSLRNAERVATERRAFIERASIMVLDERYSEVSRPNVSPAPQ